MRKILLAVMLISPMCYAKQIGIEKLIWVYELEKLERPKNEALWQTLHAEFEYYDDEVLKGVSIDLNKDGVSDYLYASGRALCGSGGCPFAIINGKDNSILGNPFGSPIIITDTVINGFLVIHSYGHMSAGSGYYSVYVFDGARYKMVSNTFVEGVSLKALFEWIKPKK